MLYCCMFHPLFSTSKIQYSMLRPDRQPQRQTQQQSTLNYQSKKLLHMIQLQILDIQSTLHYIQKKHTMHQLKEALSQIYNIFNETQPLFKNIKGMFLHQEIKKIMNCFGIIYVILMDHVQNDQKDLGFGNRDSQDGKKEQKELLEESNKRMSSFQQVQKSKKRLKPKALGGIHLYNERYSRHLQCAQPHSNPKQTQQKSTSQPTREQLNKMVSDEINDVSHINSHPDEILDIFSFKFKYGKESQIVTFHDQLLSIANFFKQSQNQAFQFLNKTKDQASLITYNDTFRDIMGQVKKEKDQKLKVFTQKIKNAFCSIKTKTEMKMAEIQTKLTEIEEVQHPKPIDRFEKETQTVYNFDEEIKSLKRRLSDSQEKYKIMMDYKKKELEQYTMLGLELEGQIGLKNREIVYLKLNIQEKELLVSGLNRKVKFLTEANRKIKDIVKTGEEGKLREIVEGKEESDTLQKQEEMDEIALQSLRKQRKMAKKILLDKRKSSLLEEKAVFMKRFTQQMDSTPKGLLSRNLSQIAEGQSSDFGDSEASMSNKNANLYEQTARPVKRKQTKKVSIANTNQGFQSSHSIKSQHEFSKSKKVLKEKHNSEMIDSSNRTSFLNKFGTPKINEDSILDQCSQDQRDFFQGRQESLNMNSEQLNKIEEMFKKQMNRTKNLMASNNRHSSFKTASKSYFGQKQLTQESASVSNNNTNRSKYSFRSSGRPEEESKSLQRPSKKIEVFQEEKVKIAEEPKRRVEKRGTVVNMNQPIKKIMGYHSAQVSVNICPLKAKAEQSTQTQQKNYTEQDDETQYTRMNTSSNQGNYVHIPKAKDAILTEQTNSDLITRSATQSKLSKNRHLKTLYTISKQNDRYIFPASKNPDKNEQEVFKNSQSCLQMNQDIHRQLQSVQNEKRDPTHQGQKIKQERQIRKLAIKCRTLQQFKTRVAEMHKSKCGHTCKHLQKFIQNYVKYKQQQKPKVKIALKNLNDNIASPFQQDNYLPLLDKKKP